MFSLHLGGNRCWVPLILAPPLNSPYWIYGVQYVHLQSQYNITWAIITSEWPICDYFTWLVMKDAAPSQNLVTTKSSKPHNTVTFGYTVKKRSTFFNVKVPQLFFHLKPDTNVILRLKFWRRPLGFVCHAFISPPRTSAKQSRLLRSGLFE